MSFNSLKNTASAVLVAAALAMPGIAFAADGHDSLGVDRSGIDYVGPMHRPPGFSVRPTTSESSSTPWTSQRYAPNPHVNLTNRAARIQNPALTSALAAVRAAAAKGQGTFVGDITLRDRHDKTCAAGSAGCQPGRLIGTATGGFKWRDLWDYVKFGVDGGMNGHYDINGGWHNSSTFRPADAYVPEEYGNISWSDYLDSIAD